jgi:hypothetical protein
MALFVDNGKKVAFAVVACRHESNLYAWIEPLSYSEKPKDLMAGYHDYSRKYGCGPRTVDVGSQELVRLSDWSG